MCKLMEVPEFLAIEQESIVQMCSEKLKLQDTNYSLFGINDGFDIWNEMWKMMPPAKSLEFKQDRNYYN